jgi:hypothetical protein
MSPPQHYTMFIRSFNWEYRETVINIPTFKVICLYCEHFPPDACNKVVILCSCALRVIHCPSRQTQQIDAIGQLAIIWVDCRWRVRPRYGVETNWWKDGEGGNRKWARWCHVELHTLLPGNYSPLLVYSRAPYWHTSRKWKYLHRSNNTPSSINITVLTDT